MAPSLWIMKDVKKQAVGLLQSGSTRDAIVMILTNDLSFSAPEVKPTNDMFDAGDMLQKALALLAQAPFTALGVPVGAPESDVRKAYKKAALKFHPDKNPKTTVLFQLISAAHDKLCDPEQRKKAEYDATHSKAPPPSQAYPTAPAAPAPGTSARRPAPAPRQTTAPTYETRQEPAFRQPGAPGPVPNSYKYTPPSHSDQQSEIYKEFERKRLEADAARRKAAQAAREAEKNARAEAVRKAQETAAHAKEEQRRREEEYMARHNRDALDRMHREQAAREAAANEKHTPRQGYQYPADHNKKSARGQDESKLPKAYQDDLEKVLNGYRKEFGRAEPVPAPVQQPKYPKTQNDKPVDSYKNYVQEMHHAHDAGRQQTKRPAATPSPTPAVEPTSPGGYKPGSIRILMLRGDCIDLEWQMPACAATTEGIMSELSWKKGTPAAPWESSGKLIAGNRCRKKNLILGITYRFRARCAVPNPSFDKNNARNNRSVSNMYIKSDWCEELLVNVPAGEKDKTPADAGTKADATGGSNYPPHRNEKVRLHPVDRRPAEPQAHAPREKETEKEHTPLDNIFGSSGRMAWTAEEAFDDDIVGANARKRKEERREARSREQQSREQQAETDQPAGEMHSLCLPPGAQAIGKEQHAVRAEPYSASQVVGFVSCDQPVEVAVTCGDYCKVRYHTLSEFSKLKGRGHTSDGWGWCLVVDPESKHRYLVPVGGNKADGKAKGGAGGSNASKGASEHFDVEIDGEVSDNSGDDEDNDMFDELHSKGKWKDHRHSQGVKPSGSSGNLNPNGRSFRDAEEEDVWFEEFDDNGNAYYVNQRTGESRWEPPEWVAEVDPESGCTYYIKLNQETAQPLHSTWSRPNFFSKIIRGIPAFDNTRGGGASDDVDEGTKETPLEKAQSQRNVYQAEAAAVSTSKKGKAAGGKGRSDSEDIIDEEDVFYTKSSAGSSGNSPAKTNPSPSSHAAQARPGSSSGSAKGSGKVRVDRSSGKKDSPVTNKFSHFPDDEHHYNYFDLEDDSDVDVVDEDEDLVEVSTNMNESPHEANLRHYFANQGAASVSMNAAAASGSRKSNSNSNSMRNLPVPNKVAPVDIHAEAEIQEEIDEELV